MNKMIDFYKENRTTDHFKNYAIYEIEIAYRCMEYLSPDEVFKPKVNEATKVLILAEQYEEAVERIIKNEVCVELGCSGAYERLKRDAIELLKLMRIAYLEKERKKKEERRVNILLELAELDREINGGNDNE